MSKTSQRKQGMYDQGWSDGRKGQGFRWKRHEFMDAYRAGYRDASKEHVAIMNTLIDLLDEHRETIQAHIESRVGTYWTMSGVARRITRKGNLLLLDGKPFIETAAR